MDHFILRASDAVPDHSHRWEMVIGRSHRDLVRGMFRLGDVLRALDTKDRTALGMQSSCVKLQCLFCRCLLGYPHSTNAEYDKPPCLESRQRVYF